LQEDALSTTAEPAIRLTNLSKFFGYGKRRIAAVRNLNLDVAPGQVYGFLGPNGAGKTTTIRMLLDLVRPSAGAASLFGQPVLNNYHILRRTGALVEGAAFYPFLSGRLNLEVLARTAGGHDPARIDALLEQVGLGARAGQKVRGYSSGMKQRLGLAAALLGDPDLLLLDEPTNGLDPAGMQEVRQFIRDQVDKHGKTVFLSSHLLGEVEQICDRVAIINRGEIVREGAVAALLSEQAAVRLEATPTETAAALIAERWPVRPDGSGLIVSMERESIPALVARLVEGGVEVYHVASQRQSLESFFLEVTRKEADHA
jgi:ABC-2 type transport system ATP-binding protein